jgi:hypothetical protein
MENEHLREIVWIAFGVLEFQPDVQKARTGLPIEPLAHYGRTSWLHAGDAHIEEISPSVAGLVRSDQTISIGALTTVLGQLACVSGSFNLGTRLARLEKTR